MTELTACSCYMPICSIFSTHPIHSALCLQRRTNHQVFNSRHVIPEQITGLAMWCFCFVLGVLFVAAFFSNLLQEFYSKWFLYYTSKNFVCWWCTELLPMWLIPSFDNNEVIVQVIKHEYTHQSLGKVVLPIRSNLSQNFGARIFPNSLTITCQPIELESCGKPQKIQTNWRFWIWGCFRGHILSGRIGLGLFVQGYLNPWG